MRYLGLSIGEVLRLTAERGAGGGKVVAEGTPREGAKQKTATGEVLRELFARAG